MLLEASNVIHCFYFFHFSFLWPTPWRKSKCPNTTWLDRVRAHLIINTSLPETSGQHTHIWQSSSDPIKCDETSDIKFLVAYISSCWNKIWGGFLPWVLWVLALCSSHWSDVYFFIYLFIFEVFLPCQVHASEWHPQLCCPSYFRWVVLFYIISVKQFQAL